MKLLDFDEMITPKILTSLYLFTSLAGVAFIVLLLSKGFVGSAIGTALAVVFNRVIFEFIIVTFKNNEYLKRIANALDGDNEGVKRPQDFGLRTDKEKASVQDAWITGGSQDKQ